jgi:hypothetical protein
LISPVYCSNGKTCHVSPSQQTGIETTIEASFRIVSNQRDVKGALLYKLRRKHAARTGNYHNSSAKFIEDTAANVHLLVAWNVKKGCDEFYVCLIECPSDFTWNEDKLWALLHRYNDRLHKNYNYKIITWLMHDGTVMKTKRKVTYGSDYKLDIIIFEGIGKYTMQKPMKIDTKRLVLSLLALIVLMYVVSLSIQPSVKLNIHNLCLNVSLTSPIYVTSDGLECHRPPDYKVYTRNTTRFGFIIHKSDNASFGVLVYKLQGRQSHKSTEIGKDTSSAAQLLVVWRISESNELYADVLLVEYDKALTWNEDKLNKLYYENYSRLKECNNTISSTWFMDNNMTLKISFNTIILKGNLELSISISEEKDNYAIRPFCIDLAR